jgi:hypothetical protein
MKNMSIIQTGKHKIMKQTTFCGKQNRDFAACLKNEVLLV